MKARSIFPKVGTEVDCGNLPDIAILYDGTVAGNPTLSLGNIVFNGGISLHKGRGVGYGQPVGAFSIPFNSIQSGGRGVKIGACTTLQNKVVSFTCCETGCGESDESMVITLRYMPDCSNPIWDAWTMDYRIVFDPACNPSCEDKLNLLATEINSKGDESPATATVTQVNGKWTLLLTGKGLNFIVDGFSGLIGGAEVVGYSDTRLMASKMKEWFGKEIFNQCTTDACYNYVEISYEDSYAQGGQVLTSSYASDVSVQVKKIRRAIIVFDVAQTTPYNALNTILYASGNGVDAKISSATPTASYARVYDYVIARVDAGDATALTTVQGDYSAEVLPISRANYVDGTSYYVITTASATPPTADGDDVITPGVYTGSVLPCPAPFPAPDEGVWEYTSVDCVEGFIVVTETNSVTQETREDVTTTECTPSGE